MAKKASKPSSPGAKKRARNTPAPGSAKKPKQVEPEILPAEPFEEERPARKSVIADDADELEIEASSEEDEADQEPSEDEIISNLPALPEPAGEQLPEVVDSDLYAVSPSDPLRRYLEEVRRHPLLDPEEEFRLASQLKEKGDLDAAKRLVSANLRLVVKIAFEYRTMYSNVMDLIQEGNIGLMKAVSKFDPTKGARLGYYASWWIRSYILKYLLDNFRLVKIGTTQAQKKLFYHLMREKERLEAQGMLAGPKLLAEKLNVRERDVIEMEQRLSGRGAEVSLNAPIDSEEGKSASHVDMLADDQELADEHLARQQLLEVLRSKLPEFKKILNEKELSILNDRILADEPATLQEVADRYGLTRERARQIEAKVIAKLREFLSL